MVKIFVGNLAPGVDVAQLKALFEEHGKVSECDVIRNYGFVHMDDQQEADAAFKQLNNYTLAGRQIHLEYSTSKLRKDPGMDELCFRCGARDHKTHNCPVHDGPKTDGGKKRPAPRDDYPPAKFRNNDFYGNRANDGYRGGYGGRFSPPIPRSGGMYNDYYGRSPASATGGLGYEDPIIPRPADRLLSPLYEEYLNARERYYYYRDRLERELYAMRRAGAVPPAAPAPPPPSARAAVGAGYGGVMASGAYGGSGSSAAPSAATSLAGVGLDPYGRSRSPSSIVRYPELYYARQAGATATTNAAGATIYDYSGSMASNNAGLSAISSNRSLYDPYP